MVKPKRTKEKKGSQDNWEFRWTAKDIFEFLKPTKNKIIWSIIMTAIITLTVWKCFASILTPLPFKSELYLALSLGLGVLIVAYTLISIIVYFVSGEWKE